MSSSLITCAIFQTSDSASLGARSATRRSCDTRYEANRSSPNSWIRLTNFISSSFNSSMAKSALARRVLCSSQEHKTRLANALFAIEELNEDDMKLVNLIQELGDERLASYLVSQLRRVADRAPRLAESLVWKIAQVIKDEDIRRLANDYDDAATYDESEDGDGSDRQDSTRNQRADGLTVEAIKRGAMLKDFLKLVEYKTGR